MQFLNPWLLAGLAGIAAPIAIHLMNRFRHRDVDWAAMDLLRKVLVVRSRRIRLEDLLLLLLRCLIVSLLALAIARPVLTPDGCEFLRPGRMWVWLLHSMPHSVWPTNRASMPGLIRQWNA